MWEETVPSWGHSHLKRGEGTISRLTHHHEHCHSPGQTGKSLGFIGHIEYSEQLGEDCSVPAQQSLRASFKRIRLLPSSLCLSTKVKVFVGIHKIYSTQQVKFSLLAFNKEVPSMQRSRKIQPHGEKNQLID